MKKDVLWAWVVKNGIAVLAWTTLAVVFNKWWIALFAILFMDKFKIIYSNYRVCDKCGKHSPYANSYNKALDKAKEAGWVHYANGNKDYCPECAAMMDE